MAATTTVDHEFARWTRGLARGIAIRLLPLAVFLVLWQWGATALNAIDIPDVGATASAFVELIGQSQLWSALWESNIALFAGLFAAVLVGIPFGLLIGRSKVADALAQGWLTISLITPMAMLIPLIIIAFGFGVLARSLIIFLFVLPMILINARAGVKSVPTDLVDMTRSFGATERQLWRYTILRAASPAIFVGLRIGVGRAVTGMVIAEWMLGAVGIGALLLQYRGSFQGGLMFALIIVLLLESLVLVQLVRLIERRVTGWAAP